MDFDIARFNMVEQQIRPWDVLDFDVLDALAEIPREHFVLPEQKDYAYADMALKLANGYTMLEPKVVARMAQGLQLNKNDNVLEIGTGSGYATALLAILANKVTSYDIDETQLLAAKENLANLNNDNIECVHGDGLQLAEGQFDAIYVGGSLESIPENLKNLLNPKGGRMVAIVGAAPVQHCVLITRQDNTYTEKVLFDALVCALQNQAQNKKTFTF
ncbi:MAG: protein-L-isoaspartate O-methyltransferase [Neisseriaceae bacterium]|nr:protein-L-isoaspartate O-methyltransferase [Neisseriaceae bacterium]